MSLVVIQGTLMVQSSVSDILSLHVLPLMRQHSAVFQQHPSTQSTCVYRLSAI